MYSGNTRRRYFVERGAHSRIIPAVDKSFSQRGNEFLLHFRSGGFGERYGKNFGNFRFPVENYADEPFYHNVSFSAPRRRGNKHVAFGFRNRAALLGRKFISHRSRLLYPF